MTKVVWVAHLRSLTGARYPTIISVCPVHQICDVPQLTAGVSTVRLWCPNVPWARNSFTRAASRQEGGGMYVASSLANKPIGKLGRTHISNNIINKTYLVETQTDQLKGREHSNYTCL